MPAFTRNADCLDFINENPQRVTCGFIELPLNHNKGDNNTITLPILIAGQTRSLSAKPSRKAILIPGGGGPGASIGFGLPYQQNEYLEIYSGLRSAGFDVVILDQRGTGLAKPALRCPETATAFINSVSEKQTFEDSLETYRNSLNECRTRLVSQRIALQNFDTYQSAKDYLAVISKLPYEWWGVLATSYATVLAQEMELLQPSVFDRIVLDSPVAVDYQRPFTFELSESSIQRIISLCEITHRCNSQYKNLENKFQQVRSRFKQQPISINIEFYEGRRQQQAILEVDDATLLDMLILAAYSNHSIANIPWIIDGLYKGNNNRLRQLATDYWYYNTDLDFASALSWVIHCKERQPMEKAYLRRHPTDYNNYSDVSKAAFNQEKLTCADWPVESPSAESKNKALENTLITTKALIIAGDLDPVINHDDISNTADNFRDKHIMMIPGTGHSVWFQSACTRQNTVIFFSNDSSTNLLDCKDGINQFK